MPKLSERLNNEGEIPDLHEADDHGNPSPGLAPFELEEARPLSRALGEYLTEPTRSRGDGDPSNTSTNQPLRHSPENFPQHSAEFEVEISRS